MHTNRAPIDGCYEFQATECPGDLDGGSGIRWRTEVQLGILVFRRLVALCGLAPKAGYLSHIVDVAPNHSGLQSGLSSRLLQLPAS